MLKGLYYEGSMCFQRNIIGVNDDIIPLIERFAGYVAKTLKNYNDNKITMDGDINIEYLVLDTEEVEKMLSKSQVGTYTYKSSQSDLSFKREEMREFIEKNYKVLFLTFTKREIATVIPYILKGE